MQVDYKINYSAETVKNSQKLFDSFKWKNLILISLFKMVRRHYYGYLFTSKFDLIIISACSKYVT